MSRGRVKTNCNGYLSIVFFTDRHTHSPHEVGMVFMPLMFMTKAQHLGMLKIFGMILSILKNSDQLTDCLSYVFRFLDKMMLIKCLPL